MAKTPSAWVLDTEIYKNYLLIGFKNVYTGKVISVEAIGKDAIITDEDAKFLEDFMATRKTIGFNSINFDMAIIYAAIKGLTVAEIKMIADEIILDGVKYWDIAKTWGFVIPRNLRHIDLIEVAFGKASLKIYNGRLHGKRMQDLPIEPTATLTQREIDATFKYWKNDLAATELLHNSLKTQLTLREHMSDEYDVDLMSKSDAQIAEAVIKAEIKKITGYEPVKPKNAVKRFKYQIPPFIRYMTPKMNDVLDALEDNWITVSYTGKVVLPEMLNEEIKIGRGTYRMGVGGLHSSESCQHEREDNQYLLFDRDVRSYYPFLIINQELFPSHIGRAFLKVFSKIVHTRLHQKDLAEELSKKLKDMDEGSEEYVATKAQQLIHSTNADSLKITINGLFGKFGSPYAVVYAPDLMAQVTISGQLYLLMLIDRIHHCDLDVEVVSANTDGIVIKCHRDDKEEFDKLVAKWEKDTDLVTEETQYAHLFSADVNNYIAVKTDGKVKTKGRFAIAEPGKPPMMNKNPTSEICVQAVIEHITKGTSLTKTIRNCGDITKFVTVRSVRGGGIWASDHGLVKKSVKHNWDITGDSNDKAQYLGKAVRWYYASGVESNIFYKTANTKGNHNKVPKSEGTRPLMELPEDMPDDIDYGRYVRESNDILREIAFHKVEV